MSSFVLAILSGLLYLAAYHSYGRFLARKIFQINPRKACPSETEQDGIDYVPTPRSVLFGHHFTSIAGTGPIVGPAIAIIWGWLPALLWVLIGSIFMGAVHDFGSMMISLRHQGKTIGAIAGDLINPRVQLLFTLIIFFALWIVIAIFGVVIASVFQLFPASVAPVWLQLPIAIWLGHRVYKQGKSHLTSGIMAAILMYITIAIGSIFPIELPPLWGMSPVGSWIILLLVYAYIASILPVTLLLQPRDYINAFQLIIAMSLLIAGICIARPAMVAPIYQADPLGAPPLFPLLFITLACGAISGFHCLVASGTSSKQCTSEKDAQSIAYGGMLLEGFLAVLVLIACGAGLGLGLESETGLLKGTAAFHAQYASWQTSQGLGAKIAAFVTGASNLISSIGIPAQYASALMGLFVAAFAATTLDTATRLQRYVVTEITTYLGAPALAKKHPATSIAVISALLLAFSGEEGKGALLLWPLFGAVNQLLGGLALLVITVWLARKSLPIWITILPMIFMFFMTAWAMKINLITFWEDQNRLLFSIGMLLILLQTWMIVEGTHVLLKLCAKKKAT
ncbi:MAG: carbon starvation protein A [Pontiellaceae bacterium]